VSGQFGHLAASRRIGRKLLLLALKPGQPGLDLAPPTLVFAQRDDAAQVSLRQPIALLPESGPTPSQGGPTGLQVLWQPVPALGSFHCCRDDRRVLQNLAQITPDKILKLACRDIPGAATLWPHKGSPLRLARAHVVVVPGVQMTAAAGAAAVAAADQAPQQIRMHAVVPPRHAAVLRQPLLHAIELSLVNKRRHAGDRNPLDRVRAALTEPVATYGPQR
jgi:hypothetical protein